LNPTKHFNKIAFKADSITNNSTDINYDSKFNNNKSNGQFTISPSKTNEYTYAVKEEFKDFQPISPQMSAKSEIIFLKNGEADIESKANVTIYETPVEDSNKEEEVLSVSQLDGMFSDTVKKFMNRKLNNIIFTEYNNNNNDEDILSTESNYQLKEVDIKFFKSYYKQIFVRVYILLK
jgi:hypothetical protein